MAHAVPIFGCNISETRRFVRLVHLYIYICIYIQFRIQVGAHEYLGEWQMARAVPMFQKHVDLYGLSIYTHIYVYIQFCIQVGSHEYLGEWQMARAVPIF